MKAEVSWAREESCTYAPLSSRPKGQRSGEISQRFLDYTRNDTGSAETNVGAIHESPALTHKPAGNGAQKTQRANPYDSSFKIVGNNVTEKDYEDFWEAFRKESTADKLDWATNIAKPHNTAKRQYVTGENGRKINPELNVDKRKQKDCRRYKCSA